VPGPPVSCPPIVNPKSAIRQSTIDDPQSAIYFDRPVSDSHFAQPPTSARASIPCFCIVSAARALVFSAGQAQ
jgi:hypothetical protein